MESWLTGPVDGVEDIEDVQRASLSEFELRERAER